MDEGLKIIVGAGVGFLAGLLGETFKFPLMRRLRRGQVRNALYKDLALILISLKESERVYSHEHRLEKSRLDVFDYFYTTERITFYEIQESFVLRQLYDLIREYTVEEDPEKAKKLVKAILGSCIASDGMLDNKRLEREEKKFVRYIAKHSGNPNKLVARLQPCLPKGEGRTDGQG